MKAIELTRFGLDGLLATERAQPQPGPGEVLLRLHAAALNFHDLATLLGMANPRMKLPCVPLSDGAGEIAGLGAGVSELELLPRREQKTQAVVRQTCVSRSVRTCNM